MAIRSRLRGFDRDISVYFPEDGTPEARRQLFARYARDSLKEAQEQNRRVLGTVPSHKQIVDGREGAPLESVRDGGHIDFEFEMLDDIFAYVGELLVKHSPVGQSSDKRPGHPGMYRESHAFFADNVMVDPGEPVPVASEYVFINLQPYARKIERGLSPQAPDGVYQGVAKMAADRFGNLAVIRFSYAVPLNVGAIQGWAASTSMPSPYRRGAKREEWLRRQPAVVIRPR